MRLICLLTGCRWDAGVVIVLGGEQLRLQVCMRCSAHKLVGA
jgi:hypothetical protein